MPSWDSALAFCFGFVSGALMVAAGQYLGDKFTDQRRDQQAKRASSKRLSEMQALMPDLLEDIRADVVSNATVRLCVLLPSPGVHYKSSETFFAYSETEHENLRGKFDILKNHGYVEEQFSSDLPVFRLTKEFIAAVRTLKARRPDEKQKGGA